MEKNQYIKIAVVILNYNGRKHLETFLPSVVKYSINSEVAVYVADNGSNDDSLIFLKTNYPSINLILLDKNYGFSEGYNKALKEINSKYFILLNSDVEVTENWILPIIDFMDKNEKIAVTAPKLRAFYDKEYFEYAGAAGGYIDRFGYPFCKGRIINNLEKDNGQYDDITEVFWASGACLFVKSELYNKAGGLDSGFFAHMEEIDLCWRLKNQGYQIFNYNKVHVFHLGGGSLPKENPFKLFLNYRNNLLLLLKNLPKEHLYKTIFIRMILDGISASIYLLTFKFSFFFAVLKAHFAFYKLFSKYKKIRKNINVVKSNHNEIYKKSIVFQYIIKKKKIFSNLKFQ